MSSKPLPDVAIEINGARRVFTTAAEQIAAVEDVSLTVAAGEFVCLQGSSGSGKSTLLNLIAGIDTPTSGSVRVQGSDVSSLSEAQRAKVRLEQIGVVFQDDALIAELSALENVALPLQARGMPLTEAKADAARELERVGIADLGERMPTQLSGGQRQRVGIARATAGGRTLLLCDEPTGALDTTNSVNIFELLRRLADEGTTVLVCSHDPQCADYADRSLVMRDGELLEGHRA